MAAVVASRATRRRRPQRRPAGDAKLLSPSPDHPARDIYVRTYNYNRITTRMQYINILRTIYAFVCVCIYATAHSPTIHLRNCKRFVAHNNNHRDNYLLLAKTRFWRVKSIKTYLDDTIYSLWNSIDSSLHSLNYYAITNITHKVHGATIICLMLSIYTYLLYNDISWYERFNLHTYMYKFIQMFVFKFVRSD